MKYEIIDIDEAFRRTAKQNYIETGNNHRLCTSDKKGTFTAIIAVGVRMDISWLAADAQIYLRGYVNNSNDVDYTYVVLSNTIILDYCIQTDYCLFMWKKKVFKVSCRYISLKNPTKVSALYLQTDTFVNTYENLNALQKKVSGKNKYYVTNL